MTNLELPDAEPPRAPRRERPIVWQVGASLAIHLAVLGFLLWPALRTALEAMPPAAIEVELVPVSDDAPSSSAASEPASSEPPVSEAPSSVEPPLSQPEPSQAPASEQPREATPSAVERPLSEPLSASLPPPAPTPMPRPITVTVGSGGETSADPASAEETGVTELTVETGDTAAGDAAAPGDGSGDAPAMGELNVAQTFYLADILGSASMANARDALENLPRDKRLSQTCNIEAVGQVAGMGRGFVPDAVIAEAFSPAVISDARLVANGAIFRSAGKWYALAFDCTLTDDLTAVTAFTFRLGPDVTDVVVRAQQQSGG